METLGVAALFARLLVEFGAYPEAPPNSHFDEVLRGFLLSATAYFS